MKQQILESNLPLHRISVPEGASPGRGRGKELETEAETAPSRRRRETALKPKDRRLLAVLGLCRALTLDQVVALLGHPRDTRTVHNRLRALAGDAGNVKLPNLGTVVLRRLRFRAYDGAPLILWAPTPIGLAIAQRELGREVNIPRADVGVAFAEHFVALTNLFVGLVRPYALAGTPIAELPFFWDVAEDTRLPWREQASDGQLQDREIRPDAVLTLPGARRRIFIECEMGTHTLVSFRKDRHQATVHKARRYETFLNGLADVPNRVTHYARKHSDGWAAEVLFLVPTEGRRASTEAALATVAASAASRVTFRACTLDKALAYVQGLLPPAAERAAPSPSVASLPFGPEEHRTVNAFVVESIAALTQANAALRRARLPEVENPPSTMRMLAVLRRAQSTVRAALGVRPHHPDLILTRHEGDPHQRFPVAPTATLRRGRGLTAARGRCRSGRSGAGGIDERDIPVAPLGGMEASEVDPQVGDGRDVSGRRLAGLDALGDSEEFEV